MKKITLALVALFTLIGSTRADNWMKHLPDDEYVANVSLPGTHDSATGNGCGKVLGLVEGAPFAQTQVLTISEQWEIGIRAFDLRPAVTEDNYLNVNHGIVPTDVGFEEALLLLRDSLIANPSEFIVIHLLHETDGEMFYTGSSDFEDLLHKTLESDELKDYIVDFRQNLTVSDMRGKMLFLYRDSYTTNPVGGMMTNWAGYIDWGAQTNGKITAGKGSGAYTTSPLYMQDLSNTSYSGGIEAKTQALGEMLDYTTLHYYTSAGSIVWVYNFASAYSQRDTIDLVFTNLVVSSAFGYAENASYSNDTIVKYLNRWPGPTGIILADYVGVDEHTLTFTTGGTFGLFGGTERTETYQTMGKTLVETIIENNWAYIEYQGDDVRGVEVALERAEEKDITTNVGDGPFLVAQSYADAVTAAIKEVEALLASNPNPSEEECSAAIQTLDEAMEAFDNAPLNTPQEGDLISIIMNQDGFRYNGYAVTFYDGAYPTAGNYGLQFTSEIDPVYAQGFTFTHTPSEDKPEGYVISFTGIEGDTHYLCNGSVYGANASQIRTTTDPDEAFVYEVELERGTAGLWHLYSSETGTYVGSNGSSSLYASNNYPNLTFALTEELDITLDVTGEWATLVLPFPADVPDGLTVYSCDEVNEDAQLVLDEETAIAANTPYVVSGAGSYNFTGAGTYYSDYSLTSGLLTGALWETEAPEDSYVLEDHGEGLAFYAASEGATVAAYQCYLTGELAGRNIYNLPGGTVAVKSIEADVDGNTSKALYDLQGRQVTNPRRGIYIRGTQKVLVK